MEAPKSITVDGKVHKITPRQWHALTRAVRVGNMTPGEEYVIREVSQQLIKKGLAHPNDFADRYERHEWGRCVATLHRCRPYPAVADAVRALIAERQAARDAGVSNA